MNECKIEKNVGHGVEDLRGEGGVKETRGVVNLVFSRAAFPRLRPKGL